MVSSVADVMSDTSKKIILSLRQGVNRKEKMNEAGLDARAGAGAGAEEYAREGVGAGVGVGQGKMQEKEQEEPTLSSYKCRVLAS